MSTRTPANAQDLLKRFAPNTVSLGYALFLAVNATVIWGGVFPFLSSEFQTSQIVTIFFLAQSLAFATALLGNALDGYFGLPRSIHWVLTRPTAVYIVGWCFLIGATYLHGISLALTLAGGVFIGFGTAVYFILWNRSFAAHVKQHATHDFMLGTLYAPLIYFSLYLIPRAMTVFLVPTVFTPLFTLAIRLSVPNLDERADDERGKGRENATRYRKVLGDYWRSAVCVGTIGLASGVVRAIAVSSLETGELVNYASMLGVLVSTAGLFLVWQYKAFRINVSTLFKAVFPVLVTAFGLLPLFGMEYLEGFAGVIYAVYGSAIMLMMLQCGQASVARGVGSGFVYGFFGCIVYAMHDFGFLTGRFSSLFVIPGANVLVTTAFVSIYVLALAMFIGQGGVRSALSAGKVSADRVDIIMTDASPVQRKRKSAQDEPVERDDLLSRQCQMAAEQFKLSERETEVMILLVHGYTAKRAAQELMVSDNTVNTHVKRMYAKLGVHKRQELVDLVRGMKG